MARILRIKADKSIRMFLKHTEYQGEVAIFAIVDGSILDGSLPNAKRKMVEVWIDIHREELLADWQLAVEGSTVYKIKGLE